MKKTILSLCLALCLSAAVSAAGNPAAATGKGDDIKPGAPVFAADYGAVSISAHLYFGDEDEASAPVTMPVYLLKKSLPEILRETGFEPVDENGQTLAAETDYLEAAARAFSGADEESNLLAVLISQELKRNAPARIETNRFGVGTAKTVRAGDYFIFAIAETDAEIMLWHFPVRLAGKKTRIELDQYNAESFF